MCTVILYDAMQSHCTAFLYGRRLLCTFNAFWRVFSMQRLWLSWGHNLWVIWIQDAISYFMPLLSSCIWDHAASPRISANADIYMILKCLASGKKSIERSITIDPQQTSVLDPLVVCYFHILHAYHCILCHGLLIISRAHGPLQIVL